MRASGHRNKIVLSMFALLRYPPGVILSYGRLMVWHVVRLKHLVKQATLALSTRTTSLPPLVKDLCGLVGIIRTLLGTAIGTAVFS